MDVKFALATFIAGGVATWFLKYLLDWLFKSRLDEIGRKISDFWAKRNATRARKKAEQIVLSYVQMEKDLADPRILILSLQIQLGYAFFGLWIMLFGIWCSTTNVKNAWVIADIISGGYSTFAFGSGFALMGPICARLVDWAHHRRIHLKDPVAARNRMIKRASHLFKSAGLGEEQVEVLIASLTAAPNL